MKSKRKHEKTAPLLDFVTARTPDECYHILKRMGADVWSAERDVFGGHPHKIRSHFSIKRIAVANVKKRDRIYLQLTGTFTPVSKGTHVVGTITKRSLQAVWWWRIDLILSVVFIVLVVFAVVDMVGPRYAFDFLLQPLNFVPLILIVGVGIHYVNSRIHEVGAIPVDLMEQVTDKLYAEPNESTRNSQGGQHD